MSGKTASGYRTNVVVLKEPEAEERVATVVEAVGAEVCPQLLLAGRTVLHIVGNRIGVSEVIFIRWTRQYGPLPSALGGIDASDILR